MLNAQCSMLNARVRECVPLPCGKSGMSLKRMPKDLKTRIANRVLIYE